MAAESTGRRKVIVVDDDEAMRTSIGALARSAGLEVETFQSAEEFIATPFTHEGPTVLVLDLCMQGLSGLGLQRRLRRGAVELPVIFLTGFGDVSSAVQAIRAGAFDFLEKPLHAGVLLERINQALDQDAQSLLVDNEATSLDKRFHSLSPRERHVYELLVQGKSNKEISRALRIGIPTVTKHRAKVLLKYGVRNVVELVAMIERHSRERPRESAPQIAALAALSSQ
jgi:FixJ family two-component response regulator